MNAQPTAELAVLQAAVMRFAQTGASDALDAAFIAAGEAVARARGNRADVPADATEARSLLAELPALEQFVDVAVTEAARTVEAAGERLWRALGLTSEPPRWESDERSGARVLVACACAPFAGRGPGWLVPRLLRLAAPRWASLLADELRQSDEALWKRALADRYVSVRRRYAPRTKWRTGGVSEVVAHDERTLEALRNRLARWLEQGPDPATIGQELEAAIVTTRTPARFA